MTKLTVFQDQPSDKEPQRTTVIAQQSVPARKAGIQSPIAFPPVDAVRPAENVFCIYGFPSGQGRVRHGDQASLRAVPYETVQHQSPVILEQKDAAGATILGGHGVYQNGFAGSDDRVHARPEGLETDGVTLLQESRDQFSCVWRNAA